MWVLHDSSIERKVTSLTPGDIHITDDERTVYRVDEHGSLRRIKNKEVVAAMLTKLKELKAKNEEEKLKEAAPLTHVDPNVIAKFNALASLGKLPAGVNPEHLVAAI